MLNNTKKITKIKGEIGQGVAVVLIVVIVAAIVGGVIGYVVKPIPVPPEIAELQAQISELEGTVSTQEGRISDLEAELATIPPMPGEGLKFVFLGESSSTDIAWTYQVDVMKDMCDALGIEFTYRFAEGDYAYHAEMIREETARGVDAIVGPWWDPTLYNDAIMDAIDSGVLVYGAFGAGPEETLPLEYVEKMGWVKGDMYEWGIGFAKAMWDYVPDGGKVFWPAEVPSGTYITIPIQAVEDYYAEHGRSINIEVIEATNDPTTSESRQIAYILANPDIDALVTSGAIAINAANLAVKELGLEPGELALIGQCNSPACVKGVEEGYQVKGVNFDYQAVGTLSTLNMYAHIVFGLTPPKQNIPILIVDNTTLDLVPEPFRE